MTEEARQLRQFLSKAEEQLASAKTTLERFERNCQHNWSDPVSKSKQIYAGGMQPDIYGHFTQTSEGRIINQREVYVPPKYDTWWERTCSVCGKIETTTQTTILKTETTKPIFP